MIWIGISIDVNSFSQKKNASGKPFSQNFYRRSISCFIPLSIFESTMSWTDVFPVLNEAQVSEFQQSATDVEQELLDDWCGVAGVVNPRSGKHLVAASLFWKHAHKDDGDLPEITREVMQNAKKLGLVKRFSPWEHYVVPLLEGAAALKLARPEIVFRVYLV